MTDLMPVSTNIWMQDDHDSPGDATTRMWMHRLMSMKEPHEVRLHAPPRTKAVSIKPSSGEILTTFQGENNNGAIKHDILWDVNGATVRLEDTHWSLRVRVICDGDAEKALGILKELRSQISFPRSKKNNEVQVKFWRNTSQGGSAFTRNIAAPTWQSIRRNYSEGAAVPLDRLMHLKPRQIGTGKIILLHGPAGTGKTTAIRALAREWRKWCSVGYAIDPEYVFGSGEYLTTLIADGNDDDEFSDGPSASNVGSSAKWRLLVIEDAEEFLVPDAKHEVGQAVSRLLNIGDGILGQGLQMMVMLTTNVPVDNLSPAIIRAGRCLANVEVPPLSKTEASTWLGTDVSGPKTLAELWETAHPSQIGTGIGTKES